MDIATIKFKDLLKVVIIGWTTGVTLIFWFILGVSLFFRPTADELSSNSRTSIPMSFSEVLIGFFGVPFIDLFQAILISALCYLGVVIYRAIPKF